MKVAVFGLGYVGCVSAACLAAAGHRVIGTDVNRAKVDLINAGESPIVETDSSRLVADAVRNGRLRATGPGDEAVMGADISLVCVGTPSHESGSANLDHIKDACADIGRSLARKGAYHVVAVRSTAPPGTIERLVVPTLQAASGLTVGPDIGVCSNPEFMREGTAVHDFHNPPYTLIGQLDARAGDDLSALYAHIDSPVIRTDLQSAEMVKYVSNAYHALKISFANEMGALCKAHGIDSHEVMRIFARDTKLNMSAAYLRPGYAFGGSCLPKDLRTLLHEAQRHDLTLPVLQAIGQSNENQARRGVEMVMKTGKTRISILGLSFKPDTDDLRESPMVWLTRALTGKALDVRVYDENVSLARLMGANKAHIEQTIPQISSLLCSSLDEAIAHAEVLVIGHRSPQFASLLPRARGRIVIDLARVADDVSQVDEGYQGISW